MADGLPIRGKLTLDQIAEIKVSRLHVSVLAVKYNCSRATIYWHLRQAADLGKKRAPVGRPHGNGTDPNAVRRRPDPVVESNPPMPDAADHNKVPVPDRKSDRGHIPPPTFKPVGARKFLPLDAVCEICGKPALPVPAGQMCLCTLCAS